MIPQPLIPNPQPRALSRYWLLLGVTALAIAGLYSLILVIARTPSLSDIPLFVRLFHEALVVHVDLSVLVWFLSIACMMWSLVSAPRPAIIPCIEEAALVSFALGTLAITFAPADPHGDALMSNYIPAITSPVFFLGLGLLLSGVALMLVKLLLLLPLGEGRGEGVSTRQRIGPHPTLSQGERASNRLYSSPRNERYIRFAIVSAGIIAAIAIMAFVWSTVTMPKVIDGQQYYELSFWGGGHVLQYVHTQILLVCWILIARTLQPEFTIKPKLMKKIILSMGLASALLVPVVYVLFDVTSMEHHDFFTNEMVMTGGIGPALLAFYIVPVLWKVNGKKSALWSALFMSVLLFLYGGTLGEIIHGQNVVIPAHYHGSIVGITLGFMGAAYLFLPLFGYRNVSEWKMAFWQPIVYGGGQVLHISGLAWSGGYGVLRKTPGALDALPMNVKVAMGFMGLGGLIAIIGGFMFVIVVARAVLGREENQVP